MTISPTPHATVSPPPAIREWLESPEFSGVVSVVQRGRVMIECARGLANRDTKEPIEIGTRFATASVGKMLTAVCMARLVDAGLCGFDQPLAHILPELTGHFDETMTMASLLSHRSGLGDYIDDDAALPFDGMDCTRLMSLRDFLPLVLQAEHGPAGSFRYSSAGFVLLGLAIEALTGCSFAYAIQQWVTSPAGMANTGFPPLNKASANLAVGYLPDGRPNYEHIPHFGGPDGGVVTTIADMRRFFASLKDGPLLAASSRDFLVCECSQISSDAAYGHGFRLARIANQMWPGHTGSDPGVSARVAFSLRADSSIIILCNVEAEAFKGFRLIREWLDTEGGSETQVLPE